MAILLAVCLAFNMIDSALMVLNVPTAIIANVAQMTHRPQMIAAAFIACAALGVPYVTMQVFDPLHRTHRRACVKLACFGMTGGGVVWALLAYMSHVIDIDTVTAIFCRNSACSLLFGFVLSVSLNNQQIREQASKGTPP